MVTYITICLFIFAAFLLVYIYKEDKRKEFINNAIDNMMAIKKNEQLYKVIRVIDGDTIVLDTGAVVRFAYIDAYEANTPIHDEIVSFLNYLILNKFVKVNFVGVDKYNRNIGDIYLEDGQNVQTLLVEQGYARVYDKYCDTNSDEYHALMRAQAQAHMYQVGAWSMLLDAPWVSRHSSI